MFVFLFSLTISRAFFLHLRPSGRLWGRKAAGGLGKLGRHECLDGRRPCPLDGNSLQGYSQPSPKSGWAGSTGKTTTWKEENQQYCPMPLDGGRSGGAASPRLDNRPRKPGRRRRFRQGRTRTWFHHRPALEPRQRPRQPELSLLRKWMKKKKVSQW